MFCVIEIGYSDIQETSQNHSISYSHNVKKNVIDSKVVWLIKYECHLKDEITMDDVMVW